MESNANLNGRNKKSGRCYKIATGGKKHNNIRNCTTMQKPKFRNTIAATLKIQNNKDVVKNSKKSIEEPWNDKQKSEMI